MPLVARYSNANSFCNISILHLLSALLVIQTIYSASINKPLIDNDDIDNFTTWSTQKQFSSFSNASIPLEYQSTVNFSKSIDSLSGTNDDNAQNQSMDQLMPDKYMDKTPTPLLAGSKLYNKADSRKRKIEKKSVVFDRDLIDWKCPNISENSRYLECGCDMPHTLRCSGDIHGLEQIAHGLRASKYSVSLLDCTLKNVTFLSDTRIFENVSLHGLVISSGEIKRVHRLAFVGMKTPLQALGLPNNALLEVPWNSLAPLTSLDRLDLSNNRIKAIGASDFLKLQNLTYLELSDNQISSISLRAFLTLKKLITLKLNGNRLGDLASSLQAIGQCINLKELDLASNSIRGPLTRNTIPALPLLESLNLDRNVLTSIHTGAVQSFPYLITLSLRHNQIDVLQDHAFSGLSSLQVLDLGYNGIVAVSGASLQHLSRLLVLNLTHNFLRALTSDLIAPLPSLKDLRLDGNDISIVAKNALDGAHNLHSLSLQDNPLSCDCSLKPFAEWITLSNIPSQDLLGAVCATPPHLEGAPLFQIPLESLNCDGNVNKYDNANVLRQLEALSKKNNLSYVKDFSDVITLKNIHLSADYGLILTWSVNLKSHEFACDAVFVYKESNINEMLMDSSPIQCESSMINNENIINVILHDTGQFVIGESYRFCLVLLQKKDIHRDLVVGCSNITKLKTIESDIRADSDNETLKKQLNMAKTMSEANKSTDNQMHSQMSDISSFDKISDFAEDELTNPLNHESANFQNEQERYGNYDDETVTTELSTTLSNPVIKSTEKLYGSQFFTNFNNNVLPGIGIGVLISSVFALIWAANKFKSDRRTSPATICYAATDDHITDIENSNRYLKLQATTTL